MHKKILLNSRILIVDDQPENVLLLERTLKGAGYTQLSSLTDSRKVLAEFTDFQPDLIAMDLRMPNVDGFALLKQLRSRVPMGAFVPVLILTADNSRKAKQEALALGAKDFLTKPIDVAEALLRIYNLLETRWLHVELRRHNESLEAKVLARTQDLEEAQLEILQRLALAAEYRDDCTGQHTQRVGELAALLARSVGLQPSHVEVIRRAAPLHDVGKIGIPDGILLKPGQINRRRIHSDQAAYRDRKDHPVRKQVSDSPDGGADRAVSSRALGRYRILPPSGQRHSAGGSNCEHRRRVRCDHARASV